MNSTTDLFRPSAIVAALLLATAPLAAQQTPAAPERPVAAPGVGATTGSGPNGATMRCRDGSYPAAGAPDSACDGKGGVLARFPVRRPRETRPTETRRPSPAERAAARGDTASSVRASAPTYEERRAANAARAAASKRPDGATLLCGDGSYVVADTASVRCASKGGVKLRFVTSRRP